MENKQPIISIVTAVFNGEKTLRATMDSVVAQLNDDFEYIVIDGASTDGTLEIVRDYVSHLAYWKSERDSGIYDAWNKGVKVAKGRFIAFVGADDMLEPGALEAYKAAVSKQPEIEYWSSRVAFGRREGRIIGHPWKWSQFRRYMTVAHVGSLHRRDLYERYGLYDVSYRIVGDYEFLLRVGKALRAGFVDTVTVVMGDAGVSSNAALCAFKETMRAKIQSGARGRVLANIEYFIAIMIKIVRGVSRGFS